MQGGDSGGFNSARNCLILVVATGLWPVDFRGAVEVRGDGPQGRGYSVRSEPLNPRTKKNELAQNIHASSIESSIRVAGYCTVKPPGPPRGPATQPFPSFKLKPPSAALVSHQTAVVAFWLAAVEVVTTTQ